MIALRAMIVRRRRGLVVLAVSLMLAFAVAWAHSGMAMDHMGSPAAVCVAIVGGTLAFGMAAVALGGAGPPRLRSTSRQCPPPAYWVTPAGGVSVRAGPAMLQVFRL